MIFVTLTAECKKVELIDRIGGWLVIGSVFRVLDRMDRIDQTRSVFKTFSIYFFFYFQFTFLVFKLKTLSKNLSYLS